MKFKTGDKVKVITGKNKGTVGAVVKVFRGENKIIVEGVNIVKKHVKPGVVSEEGGIIEIEKSINVSNVMYWDEENKQAVRLGYKIEGNKKYRFNKKTGKILEK